MRRTRAFSVLALLVVGSTAWASRAHAQAAVRPGTRGYERISKGTVDLGFENMVLVHYLSSSQVGNSDVTTRSLYAAYTGGLAFRYFLMNNLAIGASASFLLGKQSDASIAGGIESTVTRRDIGVLGFVFANYYIRLGNSLFFKPGVGVGGLYTGRATPDPANPGQAFDSTVVGGAAKLDLGFAYYASAHFNMRAGIDVIFKFGQESAPGFESVGFFSVDAAVNVGLGYSF